MNSQKPDLKGAVLAIRMSPELLKQLNALAKQKHIGTATMARTALVNYLTEEAPNALISASQSVPTSQGKFDSSRFRTPAEQKMWEEDWGE